MSELRIEAHRQRAEVLRAVVLELQRERGRLSKVTVEDFALVLAAISDPGQGEGLREALATAICSTFDMTHHDHDAFLQADHCEAGLRDADQLLPFLAASAPPPPTLDVRRVVQAAENVARRHGVAKDPPIPTSVARIWGYSAAPLDMDAEIAAEYARLTSSDK